MLLQDMAELGCLPPSMEPKATDFIPQMIATIQKIIANGHAYAVEGDVRWVWVVHLGFSMCAHALVPACMVIPVGAMSCLMICVYFVCECTRGWHQAMCQYNP